nr:phospholipase D-like domain-containing protein [Plastoroseomonas hellenica]
MKRHAGEAFTTLTDTHDAFTHIARRAIDRLVIMVPFIDKAGAAWAAELFEATAAAQRVLILRDASQLMACGRAGVRLRMLATGVFDYCFTDGHNGAALGETFHAKVVVADGVNAYVGSANLLRRSRHSNLECGMLIDGPGARAVAMLVDTVLNIAHRA